MALGRLDISAVRNLKQVALRDLCMANVFHGQNGSGKTSILESIYLLGMARSFRSGPLKSLISHGQERCTVYGEVDRRGRSCLSLGVSRDSDGGFEARVGGDAVKSASELAESLPLQVINADSFSLLAGSPSHRRQFLDWGVFHVEHAFYGCWQRFQRALKQRNTLLRRGKISLEEILPWNVELSDSGELIDGFRKQYFEALEPAFQALIQRLSPELQALELRYRRGWDRQSSLADSLEASAETDRQQGFTHVGPQRADIKVMAGRHPAADVLSRGQQKLVVCALKLAQGQLLAEAKRQECVYLVDDLPSELDKVHCQLVAEVLKELETQVFITCVDNTEIAEVWSVAAAQDVAMFHVEQGQAYRTGAG